MPVIEGAIDTRQIDVGVNRMEAGFNRVAAQARAAGAEMDRIAARGGTGFTQAAAGAQTFEQRVVGLNRELRAADQPIRAVGQGAQQVGQSVTTSATGVLNFGNAVRVAGGLIGVHFGVQTIGQVVAGIGNMAVSFDQFSRQVAVGTPAFASVADAQERLIQTAQRSGAELATVGSVYQRLSLAGQELGVSNDRILTSVDTLTRGLATFGATTSETNSTLTQFAQGFAAARFQGDELKSILENFPPLARALAEEMGVAVGELRDLGAEGKIGPEEMLGALERLREEVDRVQAEVGLTLPQAFNAMVTSATVLVGRLDEATGASSLFARGFENVSEALDSLSQTVFPTLSGAIQENDRLIRDLQATLEDTKGYEDLAGAQEFITEVTDQLNEALAEQERLLKLQDQASAIAAAGQQELTDAFVESKNRLEELRQEQEDLRQNGEGLFTPFLASLGLAQRNSERLSDITKEMNAEFDRSAAAFNQLRLGAERSSLSMAGLADAHQVTVREVEDLSVAQLENNESARQAADRFQAEQQSLEGLGGGLRAAEQAVEDLREAHRKQQEQIDATTAAVTQHFQALRAEEIATEATNDAHVEQVKQYQEARAAAAALGDEQIRLGLETLETQRKATVAGDVFTTVFTNAFGLTDQAATNLFNNLFGLFGSLSTQAAAMTGGFVEVVRAGLGVSEDDFRGFFSTVSQGLNAAGVDLESTFGSDGIKVIQLFATVSSEEFQGFLNTTIAGFSQFLTFFGVSVETQRALWQGFTDAMAAAWTVTVDNVLTPLWNGFLALFGNVTGLLSATWTTFTTLVSTLWTTTTTLLGTLWTGFQTLYTGIVTFLSATWTTFTTLTSTLWTGTTTLLGTLWTGFQTLYTGVVTFLSATWTTFTTLTSTLWTATTTLLTTLWTGFQAAYTAITAVLTTTWTTFSTTVQTLGTATTTFLTTIWTGFQAVWTGIVAVMTTVWTTFSTFIQTISTATTTLLTGIWTTFQGFFTASQTANTATYTAHATAVQAQGTATTGLLTQLWTGFQAFWTGLTNALAAAWNGMSNIIAQISGGLVGGIQTAFQGMGAFVTGVFQSIAANAASFAAAAINSIGNIITAATGALATIADVAGGVIQGALDLASGLLPLGQGGVLQPPGQGDAFNKGGIIGRTKEQVINQNARNVQFGGEDQTAGINFGATMAVEAANRTVGPFAAAAGAVLGGALFGPPGAIVLGTLAKEGTEVINETLFGGIGAEAGLKYAGKIRDFVTSVKDAVFSFADRVFGNAETARDEGRGDPSNAQPGAGRSGSGGVSIGGTGPGLSSGPNDDFAKGGLRSALVPANRSLASQPGVSAFQSGSLVTGPSFFRVLDSAGRPGLGIMGEAGAEAIFPLTRAPNGDLGIRAIIPPQLIQPRIVVQVPNLPGGRITTVNQTRVLIDARGAGPDQIAEIRSIFQDLDGSIEIRAAAVVDQMVGGGF